MPDQPTPDVPSFAAIGEAFAAVTAEMTKFFAAFTQAMTEFWQSPDGQYLRAVVEYYQQNPDELDAMIAARQAEARTRWCDCMCSRWGHLGACQTKATTQRLFALDGEPVEVPLCTPCAGSIDARRLVSV